MSGFSIESSIALPVAGGGSQKIAVSSTAAQSTAFSDHTYVYIVNSVGVYLRQGTDPTALNTGVDAYLPEGAWRVTNIQDENKLSFICDSGVSGNVWITPGA